MAGIVKDAVSFYNTFGGYLIAGVKDKPRDVVGFEQSFDCEDLKKKVQSATGHQIDFSYSIKEIQLESGTVKIGILHIPKRPDSIAPAQFKKDAPATDTGFKAYKAKDIYFRQADECKQALESDDLAFLFGKGRRTLGGAVDLGPAPVISHNLGSRDPAFITFIGRQEYLRLLWIWLCDKYNPCLLLTGIGGVGKTTIAREFADQIIISDPLGIERLIWLSAKQQFYAASKDSYSPTSRVDYTDANSLLRSILLELTYTEEDFEEEWAYEELLEKVIEALREFPSFLVIDDVDSLAPEEQNNVFHTIIKVTSQSSAVATPSRALLTARLELGAAPGQFIKVSGLKPDEFYDELQSKGV